MKLYLIFCIILFELYAINATAEISKMSIEFMIKWKINEQEFFHRPQNLAKETDCLRETLITFPAVENLSFKLCLLKQGLERNRVGVYYNRYRVILLPGSIKSDLNGVTLQYALIYTDKKYYEMNASTIHLPLTKEYVLDDRKAHYYTNEFFHNGSATIHCKIRVESQVETNESSRNNVQFKTYHPDKNSYLEENVFAGIDFIDEYIYSGEVPLWNTKRAILALKHSDLIRRFDAPDLINWSIEYLMQNIAENNVMDVFNIALKMDIENLRKKCVDYIGEVFFKINQGRLRQC